MKDLNKIRKRLLDAGEPFWMHKERHIFRPLSLESGFCLYYVLVNHFNIVAFEDSNTLDTESIDISDIDERAEGVFYVTVNNVEYYFDNSTDEMIFQSIFDVIYE